MEKGEWSNLRCRSVIRGVWEKLWAWGRVETLGVYPELVWRLSGHWGSLSHRLARKERHKLVWML